MRTSWFCLALLCCTRRRLRTSQLLLLLNFGVPRAWLRCFSTWRRARRPDHFIHCESNWIIASQPFHSGTASKTRQSRTVFYLPTFPHCIPSLPPSPPLKLPFELSVRSTRPLPRDTRVTYIHRQYGLRKAEGVLNTPESSIPHSLALASTGHSS